MHDIARIYPVYKITVLMCGCSQIMANNCNLIKSVYRVYVNGIVTGSSTVFRHNIVHVYFAGLHVELLERAGLLREVLWERDRDNMSDTQLMDFVISTPSASHPRLCEY